MTYRIRGLDPAPFQPLFEMPDEELEKRGVVRMTVTAKPSCLRSACWPAGAVCSTDRVPTFSP